MTAFEKLKNFFDEREVAHKATKPLGKNAVGEVIIIINEEPKSYAFKKSGDFATLFDEKAIEPDFTMKLEEGAVDEMINLKSESVGDFGVHFFKVFKAKEEGKIIKLKLNIGFFKIISKGYLKVLLLGGPIVLSALTKLGINGIEGLKKILSKKNDE